MKNQGENFNLDIAVPNDGKRHKNPHNKRHKTLADLKEQVLAQGGAWHNGKPWTNSQLDHLLNLYFNHCSHDLRSKRTLELKCGRSFDAIGTKLRKLGIRYLEDGSHLYRHSAARNLRIGAPWQPADFTLIEKATIGQGLVNKAYTPRWLAELMARTLEETVAKLIEMGGLLPGYSFGTQVTQLALERIHNKAKEQGYEL